MPLRALEWGDRRRLGPNDPSAGKNITASVLKRYLYGRAIGPVFAECDCAGHVLWGLGDQNSTVCDVGDGSGTLVDTVVFDRFADAAVSMLTDSGVSFMLDGMS